jgi:hypothetical protein
MRQVWVYTLGSNYAIEDPDLPTAPGEYRPIYIFDSRFAYKVTIAGL